MPKLDHTSESLAAAKARMDVVGPPGYMDRDSLDDYVDVGEWFGVDDRHSVFRRASIGGEGIEIWCPARDEELLITKPEYVDRCPMCGAVLEGESDG